MPSSVKFFYIKNQAFRVIHVDGAIGGVTPRGHLHLAMYSERPAIPQATAHSLSDDGTLSEPQEIEGKAGIIRELDIDMIMSKQVAIELRDWLTKHLELIDSLEKQKGS